MGEATVLLGKHLFFSSRFGMQKEAMQVRYAAEQKKSPAQQNRSTHFNWQKTFGADPGKEMSDYFKSIFELSEEERKEERKIKYWWK